MCELKFEFSGDNTKLVDDLRDSVESGGGTFSGNYERGECHGSSPVKYKFDYTFSSNSDELLINIQQKPFYISCKLIEDSIKEYLKKYDISAFNQIRESISMNQMKMIIDLGEGPQECIFDIEAPDTIGEACIIGYGDFQTTKDSDVVKIKLLTLGSVKEFKTDTCRACTDNPWPFTGRTCTDVPCAYTRDCDKDAMLEVGYPGKIEAKFKQAMEECAKVSLALVVPLLMTGQFQAAIPIFFASFKECLIAKGYQEATKIYINIYEKKRCNSWSRV